MSNCSAVNAALAELGFHGSYRPQDITFLLKACDIQPTPVAENERLIQSGLKHYSEMISEEKPPTDEHMAHFQRRSPAPRLPGRDTLQNGAFRGTHRRMTILAVIVTLQIQ